MHDFFSIIVFLGTIQIKGWIRFDLDRRVRIHHDIALRSILVYHVEKGHKKVDGSNN